MDSDELPCSPSLSQHGCKADIFVSTDTIDACFAHRIKHRKFKVRYEHSDQSYTLFYLRIVYLTLTLLPADAFLESKLVNPNGA